MASLQAFPSLPPPAPLAFLSCPIPLRMPATQTKKRGTLYSPGETHETPAKLEANAHQIQKQGTVYHCKQQNSVTISTIRTVLA